MFEVEWQPITGQLLKVSQLDAAGPMLKFITVTPEVRWPTKQRLRCAAPTQLVNWLWNLGNPILTDSASLGAIPFCEFLNQQTAHC